jgi:hypothetical protein
LERTVTVPMEGLTNRQSRAVIAEDEDRARAVLAEQRAVYGDPDAEARRILAESKVVAVIEPKRDWPGTGHPALTAGELDAIAATLFEALQMGRRFHWSGKQRERVRSALGKLNGADYR